MGNVGARDTTKDSTVLTENEIVMLLNNTSFDREEILDWHKGFLVSYIFQPIRNKKYSRNEILVEMEMKF